MGFTSTAKHLEQLWDEVDEEVLAGAVLIPQRPDPALNSSSATNSNSNVNANNNSNVNTSTALYPSKFHEYSLPYSIFITQSCLFWFYE